MTVDEWYDHYRQASFNLPADIDKEISITNWLIREHRDYMEAAINCGNGQTAARRARRLADLNNCLAALDMTYSDRFPGN